MGLVIGFTSLVEAAPINWGPLHALRTPACPIALVRFVAEQIDALDDAELSFMPISYIELTLLLACTSRLRLPKQNSDDIFDPACFFARPSIATCVGHVKSAIRHFCTAFGLGHYHAGQLCRAHSHIYIPTDGIILRISGELRDAAISRVLRATNGRGIRRVHDLARPI